MKLNRAVLFSLPLLMAMTVVAPAQDTLNHHAVKLDSQGKLISWVQPQDQAYDKVIRLAWDYLLKTVPVEDNGLKTYYTYCCLHPVTGHYTAWPHNPAGLYSMLTDSASVYYAYSGDRAPLELARSLVDYQLAHGTTPANGSWPRVPYASSNHGALEFRGADGFRYGDRPGIGDGYGYIEPDKVGEMGYAYIRLYEISGNQVYHDAAISCADALAAHIRPGDAEHSPWPFRVNAETNIIKDEYSSNVLGAIKLFAELSRLNIGDVKSYRKARTMAWEWMMKYPMQNNAWSGYFEDVYSFDKPVNLNQYNPMEVARYVMQHPELDVDWRTHAPALIAWVEKTLVNIEVKDEPAVQWGANAVSEQVADFNKMGSHTSRYASVNALWYELTGDSAAKEKAFRSFNWASYMCRETGMVQVGPIDQSIWFSDGYGDYIRHFIAGMGSVPEWAPAGQNHLLRSTSAISDVKYDAKGVSYTAFDADGNEVLKLNFTPKHVTADNKPMTAAAFDTEPGWKFDAKSGVLKVHRSGVRTIRIAAD